MLFSFLLTVSTLLGAEPFTVTAERIRNGTDSVVAVRLTVENGNYIYAESLKVTPQDDAVKLTPLTLPEPEKKLDKFTEKEEKVYTKNVTFTYKLIGSVDKAIDITVDYQGCGADMCYMPQSKKITLTPDTGDTGPADTSTAARVKTRSPETEWENEVQKFVEAARTSGYMDADTFTSFIESAESGKPAEETPLEDLEKKGVLLTILIILLGGLALNLTPCVLPLIPINLAIIGAGTQAKSRKHGFIAGAVYGLGIAIAYGGLGLFVVFTGSTFGALNASPVFNFAIAVIFLILTLATFDVFSIDLSGMGGGIKNRLSKKGGLAAVFLMGLISAALAGACVAPIVISVLVLSGSLYSAGNVMGLFLPFILGIGMALPWPFAGAGLAVLPNPGNWMKRVKIVFGVFILALALYYGYTGYTLLSPQPDAMNSADTSEDSGGWEHSLTEGLRRARREGKPVLIDFWATWCKSCMAMNRTTLKDPKVNKRLAGYVKVKFQAEVPKEPEIKKVLDHFKVAGLPTFIIMRPFKD